MLDNSSPVVKWRFLSANNRRLCESAVAFGDPQACLATVRELRSRLGEVTVVTVRDGPRRWAWRARLAGQDLAVSSRSYERWVEADRACALFIEQVASVPEGRPPQVVQF